MESLTLLSVAVMILGFHNRWEGYLKLSIPMLKGGAIVPHL